ncbi:protein of unknown function [Azospirillum lipoferum 4B]|uniref:Uncharacterized protein n=1 Tax=Azospirillum lipoferum (strain 4B) TaxID=862719 RepID=G7Z9N3_AZOL4|nr:protein of unknown function [Azospirillum lipoferum 4B]
MRQGWTCRTQGQWRTPPIASFGRAEDPRRMTGGASAGRIGAGGGQTADGGLPRRHP